MPKRTDIKSILIIGAGPIVIGQACEFDYSGTQACKALKDEGYRVVLVNSNPATIMTDPDLADATYIEPITPEIVAKIIEKERPDALLPTMGGQTALNCALSLRKMGVLRDRKDNCIIICSIENVDPMGVHTGDSITIAPALTLTDKEYQILRDASIAVLREIGVETGGSNVQFAINPEDGRLVVIEMNPRVSRSSALASKATGFPIAKVAAKLAIGYTLDEIENDITGGATPASFEPTIDYIVTKVPRFAFEKFPGAEPLLTTSMKSVGEVMAIGRPFPESQQKALRGLETGLTGLDDIAIADARDGANTDAVRAALALPTPDRIRVIAQAFRYGTSIEDVHGACMVDPWFLARIKELVEAEATVRARGLPDDRAGLLALKQQ